jgi:ribonuclease R
VRRVPGAKVLKKDLIYPYTTADMATLGEQCSMTERRADDATREVDAWLKCEFLRDKVGEVYPGVIAAVTGFGIFVELQDLYIEGLVHISALPGDYYHFDQAKQRLIGEHTRRIFQLGGSVSVKVARVDLDERKIDLEMDEVNQSAPAKKPPQRKHSGKKQKQLSTGAKRRKSQDAEPLHNQRGAKRHKESGAKSRGKRGRKT